MTTWLTITSAVYQTSEFHLVPSPTKAPRRLSSPISSPSLVQCAHECKTLYGGICKTLLYNSDTRLCIPGTQLMNTEPLPSSAEGQLSKTNDCDIAAGFSQHTAGSTTSCLRMFGPSYTALTYAEATNQCVKLGAHLMSVKTAEKLEIVKRFGVHEMPDVDVIWVGCDDLENEGTFVWSEDGSLLTQDTVDANFGYGEPDDYQGAEDCVVFTRATYWPHNLTYPGYNDILADWWCSAPGQYICEMSTA